MEILVYEIEAGKPLVLMPGDEDDTLEFYYVLEGQMRCDSEGLVQELEAGDYFTVHQLTQPVYFSTLSRARLLAASNQPVFDVISARIKELNTMVKNVEQKDSYTLNHSYRVKEYALSIGKWLNLSRGRMDVLRYAALFHDIGKIHIPDTILNKPGSLSAEEMDCVRGHSSWGRQMVDGALIFDIARIVEQHHERLDGTGYPSGLRGDEITLEARIIAVADSYDAMTSDRVYRRGMEPLIALSELQRMAGSAYDARVVDALAAVIREKAAQQPETNQ